MLVTLIAAMVVFAVLGAVMIGMFGTAALSQASGNNSMKAYYLAESGFRYAASRYIAVNLGSEAANETARDSSAGNRAARQNVFPGPGRRRIPDRRLPLLLQGRGGPPSATSSRTRVTGGFPLEGTELQQRQLGPGQEIRRQHPVRADLRASACTPMPATTRSGSGRQFGRHHWDNTIAVGATVTPSAFPTGRPSRPLTATGTV